jgi:Tol biopolymer transport system component
MKTAIGFLVLLFPAFLAASDRGLPVHKADFPAASRIVFSSDMEGNEDLYLLSRNVLTRLTDDPATDQWPVPDGQGKTVVFTSNRAGSFDIYTLDLESRTVRRLTSDPRDEVSPSWSADDAFIYYDLNVKGSSWRTMKMDVRTGMSKPLFEKPPYGSTIVAFESRKGDAIYFTGKVFLGWLVAKYERTTGAFRELTRKGSCRPKISPDGALVAYVGHDDDGLGDVFVMAPDGSAKRNVTRARSRTHDYYPCFSPDGGMLVFSSSPKEKGKNAYQLYTIDVKSGEVKRILTTSGNDSFPFWFD